MLFSKAVGGIHHSFIVTDPFSHLKEVLAGGLDPCNCSINFGILFKRCCKEYEFASGKRICNGI